MCGQFYIRIKHPKILLYDKFYMPHPLRNFFDKSVMATYKLFLPKLLYKFTFCTKYNLIKMNLPESFVMMPVHIANKEIKDRHIHYIIQTSTLIIGMDLFNKLAIVGICLPLCFPSLVVRSPPWMPPYL